MNRILLNNIWIRLESNKYVIMNLTSLRREYLSEYSFNLFVNIASKISNSQVLNKQEQSFYDHLLQTKQILTPEIQKEADELIKKSIIVPKIINGLMINLTYNCNFNCSYCYQNDFKKKLNGKFMTAEDIVLIDKLIRQYNNKNRPPRSITISGGESLLPQNLPAVNKIIELFQDNTWLTLYTNGVNILEYWDKIPFAKFKTVQVSLDGTENTIKNINGYNSNGHTMEKIVSGIKKLAENNVLVNVVSMYNAELINDFDSYYDYLNKNGLFEYDNIRFMVTPIVDHNNYNYSLSTNFFTLDEFIKFRNKIATKTKNTRIYIDTLYELRNLRGLITREKNNKADQIVHRCSLKFGIPILADPSGKIHWCVCVNPDVSTIIGEYKPELKWNYDMIEKLIKRNITMPVCNSCELRYICGSGCPLTYIKNEDDINQPYCGALKNKFIMDNLEQFL